MNQTATARFRSVSFGIRPAILLIGASLLVAIAILIDGSAARAINGVAGILWIGSAILIVRSLRGERDFWPMFGVVAVACFVLVLLVRPSNVGLAIVGFALGGASIALIAKDRRYDWALLLPAMWLPMHLLVAIGRTLTRAITGGETSVRSDPPPTAALVPFAMVVSAVAGAWMVEWWRRRELHSNPISESVEK